MDIQQFSEGLRRWRIENPFKQGDQRPYSTHGSAFRFGRRSISYVARNIVASDGDGTVVVEGIIEPRVGEIYERPWVCRLIFSDTGGSAHWHSECGCGREDNCAHAYALLEGAQAELAADVVPASLASMLSQLEDHQARATRPLEPPAAQVSYALVLKPGQVPGGLAHSIPMSIAYYGTAVPEGEKPRKVDKSLSYGPDAMSFDDSAKVALLGTQYFDHHGLSKGDIVVDSYAKEAIFEELLASSRVYFRSFGSNPLRRGDPIDVAPRFVQDDAGHLEWIITGPDGSRLKDLYRLRSLWEFDPTTRVLRRVVGDEFMIKHLYGGKEVLPTQVKAVRAHLERTGLHRHLPLPLDPLAITDVRTTPTAVLRARLVEAADETRFPVALLTFDYDGHDVIPTSFEGDVATVREERAIYRIHRHEAAQAQTYDRLEAAGFRIMAIRQIAGTRIPPDGIPCVNGGGAAIDDLHHFWQTLDACEAAGMRVIRIDDFPVTEIAETTAYHTINVVGGDAYEMDVGIEVDGERHALAEVLAATVADARFPLVARAGELPDARWTIRLPDSRLVRLPLAELRALMAPVAEWLGESKVRVTRIQAAMIANELDAEAPRELQATREALQRLATIGTAPLPHTSPNFVGELRHYQREGLRWLNTLAEAGLGGVLGDDMGLGKTTQLIAHLLHLKDVGALTNQALIVLPASLTSTWSHACAQFAPSLRVEVLHGSGRAAVHERAGDADVLITTYGTLVRDIEMLEQRRFSLVVADESQNIRNPKAQSAKTVRRLQADRFLNLTGTPLENRLLDLWAQMDLAVPGLLGSARGFTRQVANPIQNKGSEMHRAALARRIAPFLLRRTKQEVASELPEKITTTIEVELAPAQRTLYEALRAAQHAAVQAAIAERGINSCGIVVLDALLKLRQVCCDPVLAPMASAKKIKVSAKLDALMERLEEAVEGGHRVLVYSSFTTMLDKIAARVTEAGMGYQMLTGKTTNRGQVVDAFQNGSDPLFLLSLKAGGVGLNLTAADTVIIYDPWWNPAAEDQATDRAHRIGQDKTVNVYRLIAKDTIEERIEVLKASKAALASAILDGEGDVSSRWTEQDIDHLFRA